MEQGLDPQAEAENPTLAIKCIKKLQKLEKNNWGKHEKKQTKNHVVNKDKVFRRNKRH